MRHGHPRLREDAIPRRTDAHHEHGAKKERDEAERDEV
jgi:hypothetical protein